MSARHQCCLADIDGNHKENCPMVYGVNESFKQDGARHTDNLINHSATAIRRRVLKAQGLRNGMARTLEELNALNGWQETRRDYY